MGFRSWLRDLMGAGRDAGPVGTEDGPASASVSASASTRGASVPDASGTAAGATRETWEPVPAYLPVDARDHLPAVIATTAIAAGDVPDSALRVTRVLIANPEHRRVTAIAAALAAGSLEDSSFVVRRIHRLRREKEYVKDNAPKALEETHAA